MAKNREDNSALGPAITTRMYVETIQMLRILAEAKGVPLIDYVHTLALRAMAEDGQELQAKLQKWQKMAKEARG